MENNFFSTVLSGTWRLSHHTLGFFQDCKLGIWRKRLTWFLTLVKAKSQVRHFPLICNFQSAQLATSFMKLFHWSFRQCSLAARFTKVMPHDVTEKLGFFLFMMVCLIFVQQECYLLLSIHPKGSPSLATSVMWLQGTLINYEQFQMELNVAQRCTSTLCAITLTIH